MHLEDDGKENKSGWYTSGRRMAVHLLRDHLRFLSTAAPLSLKASHPIRAQGPVDLHGPTEDAYTVATSGSLSAPLIIFIFYTRF